MPRRITGQSAVRNMVPKHARALNVNYENNYIVKAKHQSESKHFGKRILVTYLYLLILRELSLRGALPDGSALSVPMTLQANKGHGENQCAHQLLGELTVGGRHIYTLLGLTKLERRSIIYCTSAVSDIHKSYNFVDGYIEKNGRDYYTHLANRIIMEGRAGRALNQTLIWSEVIEIFSKALTHAKPQIYATTKPNETQHKDRMIKIIEDHIDKIIKIKAKYELPYHAEKTVEMLMEEISKRAF